jgi:chemotaxis protein methyltransferase CheR
MPDLKIVASTEREFAFSQRDFDRVKALIHVRAGISLNDSKENMVYSRLSRRLRAIGDQTFTEYLSRLDRPDEPEWQAFVNALTTNLTSFFRESHHFPILARHLQSLDPRAPLNIWCCAASTGEEPYSIAMTVLDAVPTAKNVNIIATDIDTGVLSTAVDGVYSAEAVSRIDASHLRRHFLRGDGDFAGLYKVRPAVQALVTFRQLNLLDRNWSAPKGVDVIFCRNVMIYFDRPTQMDILSRFVPLMNPGALLFAGHSENFHHSRDHFQLMGKTVYLVNKQAKVRDAA